MLFIFQYTAMETVTISEKQFFQCHQPAVILFLHRAVSLKNNQNKDEGIQHRSILRLSFSIAS